MPGFADAQPDEKMARVRATRAIANFGEIRLAYLPV
jgi:hypothetical protein